MEMIEVDTSGRVAEFKNAVAVNKSILDASGYVGVSFPPARVITTPVGIVTGGMHGVATGQWSGAFGAALGVKKGNLPAAVGHGVSEAGGVNW
jgi:hypothetical protein